MSELSAKDEWMLNAFQKSLGYWHWQAEDYPPFVQLYLAVNKFINGPDMCLWIAKNVDDKKLGRRLSKECLRVQAVGRGGEENGESQ